jgi:hypothetical protein
VGAAVVNHSSKAIEIGSRLMPIANSPPLCGNTDLRELALAHACVNLYAKLTAILRHIVDFQTVRRKYVG